MKKELDRERMKRSKLRNNFWRTRPQKDILIYNQQQNFFKKLLRTTKKLYFSNLDIKKVVDNKSFWKAVSSFFFLQNVQKVIKSSLMKTKYLCLVTTNYVKILADTYPISFLNLKFQAYPKYFKRD